jgi:hypothetical protein
MVSSPVRKIIETVFLDRYGHQLLAIHQSQHGFIHGKSTESAISELSEKLRIACNKKQKNESVVCIFYDVQKAFDLANRPKIVEETARVTKSKDAEKILNFLLKPTNSPLAISIMTSTGPR